MSTQADIPAKAGAKAGVVYRPMTDEERRAAAALDPGRVTYLPGSFAKRFQRNLALIASQAGECRITDKQAFLLWSNVWKYRRQVRDKTLVALATRQAAAAEAAVRERAHALETQLRWEKAGMDDERVLSGEPAISPAAAAGQGPGGADADAGAAGPAGGSAAVQ
jgi:hypothetical protein